MASTNSIKTAIIEREEEFKEKAKRENFIERELKIDTITTDVVSIITGIRRCGKSILAFLLTKDKNAAYVNFEDERLQLKAKELNSVLKAIYEVKGDVDFIVFDEIQNIEGWEKFIARIILNKKIIITGSNARLLSKELATYLTGRHIDYELFPFSFREYLRFGKFEPNIYLTKDVAKTKSFLEDYIEQGGFPLVYRIGIKFVIENYKDIVERDIIQRYNVKYGKMLKDIARYLISNSGNLISFNRISKIFEISVDTIREYSAYFVNAYLLFFLNKFDYKLKEQEKSPKKVYCIDTGIINAFGFKVSQNMGKLMENLVAIELFRRKSYFNKGLEIFYFKDYQQHEVDFLIKEGLKVKQLIQVTYANSFDEIEHREIRALLKAKEIFKEDNPELLIITWDYEDEKELCWFGRSGKIKFVPLWKWLLNL